MTVNTEENYIQARKSQLTFYRDVPLYAKTGESNFVLYKPTGITLGEMRIKEGLHPDTLFIRSADKLKGLQEAQKAFNNQLEGYVKSGDPEKVKETLVTIVEETLMEPRSGGLEGVSDTVGILIGDYSKEVDIIRQLIDISSRDYSTVIHSINVMAFALGFALYHHFSHAETKTLGLAALLHDVGKTKIPLDILSAPRELTDEEFEVMKTHTTIGYQILNQCRFKGKEISTVARDHHERIDGSGYPNHEKDIMPMAQIVGIIDCYEALTNDDRPYRNAMEGFQTFNQILKQEVIRSKFSSDIYTQFVRSLEDER